MKKWLIGAAVFFTLEFIASYTFFTVYHDEAVDAGNILASCIKEHYGFPSE